MRYLITIAVTVNLACSALFAHTTNKLAPGAPGNDAHWPSAAKNGFGTSNTLASQVWFTLRNRFRLAVNMRSGHNVETPNAVSARYLQGSTND